MDRLSDAGSIPASSTLIGRNLDMRLRSFSIYDIFRDEEVQICLN